MDKKILVIIILSVLLITSLVFFLCGYNKKCSPPTVCSTSLTPIPTSLTPIPTSLTPIPSNNPDISNQPENTIQIINSTGEDPLHVFLSTGQTNWVKQDGNGYCFPPINWGEKGNNDLLAWDPVGAGLLTEAVIPRGGNIILQLTKNHLFRVSPLKLRNNDYTSITSYNIAINKVMKQWPVLIEGGMDVVADSSSVDGINFRMKYELSVADTANKYKIVSTTVNNNPCAVLPCKYQLEAGCRNPVLIDCTSPTCDCCSGTQKCRFNTCSQTLFSIPDNLTQYIGYYDIGDKNSCSDCPSGCPNTNEKVKPFINQSSNLKQNSPLKMYCDSLQQNSGDFTSYCYDYNDVTSSPTLASPYKMRVTYMDL